MKMDEIIIYIDGASKGNPGEGACAAIFMDKDGNIIGEEGMALGICTNNFAEYSSLNLALSIARNYNAKKIKVFSDSELLVKQFNGEYKIKNEKLKELMKKIKEKTKYFKSVEVSYIPREENKIADSFVNNLLKAKKLKKKEQKKLTKEREKNFLQKDLF